MSDACLKNNENEKGILDSGVSMVCSSTDLWDRLMVAKEGKLLTLSPTPEAADLQVIAMLGLPLPDETTIDILLRLKPVYTHVLEDIRQHKQDSRYLEPLLDDNNNDNDNENKNNNNDDDDDKNNKICSAKDDSAALLILYFLEFPYLVRQSMISSGVLQSSDQYELSDIVQEIALSRVLGKWCRAALLPLRRSTIHPAALASALSLISALKPDEGKTANSKTRKFVQSVVFRNQKQVDVGFRQFRSDVTALLADRMHQLHPQTIVALVSLQYHLLRVIYPNDDEKVVQLLHESLSSSAREIEAALDLIREPIGEKTYQNLRAMMGYRPKPSYESSSSQQRHQQQTSTQDSDLDEFSRCSAPDCRNVGKKRCTICKVANYCSRQCQVWHWKNGHKQECPRMKAAHALRRQDRLLTQHPGVDYVLIVPPSSLVAIRFGFQMATEIFAGLRHHAVTGTPFAVCRMYDILSEHQPPDFEPLIRKQLISEYGVDPLSQEARDTDPTKYGATPPPESQHYPELPRDDPHW